MELYYDDWDQLRYEKDEKNSFNQLIAMSNSLAKAQIDWTITSKKLFVAVLSHIRYKEKLESNEIVLDKDELIEALGYPCLSENKSPYLRKEFQTLRKKSEIHWTDPNDKNIWEDGVLFIKTRSTKTDIVVTVNPDYQAHLEELARDYTMMLAEDVYKFKSSYSYDLFKELNRLYDSRTWKNHRTFTTKQLKEVFGLVKEDYVRKTGAGAGKFDRTNFEKRCIITAIDEINKGKMMKIIEWGKDKRGNRVQGYFFDYAVKTQQTPPPDYEDDDTLLNDKGLK